VKDKRQKVKSNKEKVCFGGSHPFRPKSLNKNSAYGHPIKEFEFFSVLVYISPKSSFKEWS